MEIKIDSYNSNIIITSYNDDDYIKYTITRDEVNNLVDNDIITNEGDLFDYIKDITDNLNYYIITWIVRHVISKFNLYDKIKPWN